MQFVPDDAIVFDPREGFRFPGQERMLAQTYITSCKRDKARSGPFWFPESEERLQELKREYLERWGVPHIADIT